MLELEKTYLAKNLPDGLTSCPVKELIDVYFPMTSDHPKLRIRKRGEKFEMTKKELVNEGDASAQIEQNIALSAEEFAALQQLPGKKIHKLRYYYAMQEKTAEIDVFQGALQGLVLIDVEFDSAADKDAFPMPDFCLCDVTQETFIAGGVLCGKSYADIEQRLQQFGYHKIG